MKTKKFKNFDKVKWVSQSGGFVKEKKGEIAGVIPPNVSPFLFNRMFPNREILADPRFFAKWKTQDY